VAPNAGPELDLLAREVKHGCTLALLCCLDREAGVAYVLGEVCSAYRPPRAPDL
jgi:hypothetical protein